MAERVALWGRDIDELSADLDDDYVDHGEHDPITEPIAVGESDYDGLDVAGDERIVEVESRSDAVPVRAVVDRLPSASTALTFKPAATPWYRTGRGLVVLIGVVAVAVVLSLMPVLLRGPAPSSDDLTNTP